MSHSLSDGGMFHTLNVQDNFNREAVWIEVGTSLPAEHLVRILEGVLLGRAAPKQIRMDNSLELISRRPARWAREKQVELVHITPGQPAQNSYIKRVHRTFREEVLLPQVAM